MVRSVYEAVRDFCSQPVTNVAGARDWVGEFASREIEVMDIVLERYGRNTAVALSGATHKPGTPWQTVWSLREEDTEISNDLITYFYRRLLAMPSHSAL